MNLNPVQVRSEIERLKAIAPECWEDGEEQLLEDMLLGSTTLHDFLAVVIDQEQDAAAMAGSIAGRIAELELRQARCVRKSKTMRALALALMQQAGLPKATLPIATLSVRKGSESLKVDAEAVPEAFLKYTPKPDTDKIRAALEAGEQFNFAQIVRGEPSLTVRVK